MTENEIGKIIVDKAVQIHRVLDPGMLETVYENILTHDLRGLDLQVEQQVPVATEYRGPRFEKGFRADLITENKVIVELKCVENFSNAHKKTTSHLPAPE